MDLNEGVQVGAGRTKYWFLQDCQTETWSVVECYSLAKTCIRPYTGCW